MTQNCVLPKAVVAALQELGARMDPVTWQLRTGPSKISVVLDYTIKLPLSPIKTSSVTCTGSSSLDSRQTCQKDTAPVAGPPEAPKRNNRRRKTPSEQRRNRDRLITFRKKKRDARKAKLNVNVSVKEGSFSDCVAQGDNAVTALHLTLPEPEPELVVGQTSDSVLPDSVTDRVRNKNKTVKCIFRRRNSSRFYF